jgi:hypothetical protein
MFIFGNIISIIAIIAVFYIGFQVGRRFPKKKS